MTKRLAQSWLSALVVLLFAPAPAGAFASLYMTFFASAKQAKPPANGPSPRLTL